MLQVEAFDWDGAMSDRLGRNDFLGTGEVRLTREHFAGALAATAIEVPLYLDARSKKVWLRMVSLPCVSFALQETGTPVRRMCEVVHA